MVTPILIGSAASAAPANAMPAASARPQTPTICLIECTEGSSLLAVCRGSFLEPADTPTERVGQVGVLRGEHVRADDQIGQRTALRASRDVDAAQIDAAT